jgi:Zn-dependent protease with chaperone function
MLIHYQEFIHPEDETARRRLEAVPGFRTAVKWLMGIGVETLCHGLFMAEKIRLSSTQLPELYNHLPPICQRFGIAEPEFYLEAGPPNAYTLGDTHTFLVITSGLLSHVKNDDELIAVLAHECGHILCRHVLYKTMASMMLNTVSNWGAYSVIWLRDRSNWLLTIGRVVANSRRIVPNSSILVTQPP